MPADTPILRALQSGDPQACEILFDRYADRIYRLALGLLEDESEAEDILQETCLKVMTRKDRFEGRSSLGTWMYRMAYNACVDRLRRRADQPLPADEPEAEEDLPIPMPALFQEWDTPESLAIGSEDRSLLEAAIRRLAEPLRVVFTLRDIEDLSTAETAEVLGITPTLVKVRLHRARLSLREDLAAHFAERQVG